MNAQLAFAKMLIEDCLVNHFCKQLLVNITGNISGSLGLEKKRFNNLKL